jgi:hypothetical protein
MVSVEHIFDSVPQQTPSLKPILLDSSTVQCAVLRNLSRHFNCNSLSTIIEVLIVPHS